MSKTVDSDRRTNERKKVTVPIEFVVEGDVINATSVDISDSGVRIDTDKPLRLHLRFMFEGDEMDFKARFAWARKTGEGGMTYGLEFLGEAEDWDEEN